MATQERGEGSGLKDLLAEEFYRYDFFRAVSLLETLALGKKPVGEALRPGDEPVRFKVRPGFAFPASAISGFRFDAARSCAEMEVSFLGLIGPHGVLPHWYNEMAQERVRNKDASLVDFLDIFHHRLLSLFFLAWKRSRISYQVTLGGTDRFSMDFRHLLGISAARATKPTGVDVESLLYFTGILARQAPSVSVIESAVAHFSGQEVVVQQFVARVLQLPPDERTMLGKANSTLGTNAICGSQVWENMSKFRVELGPMDHADFIRFLPGGELLRPIFALVRFIVGIEYEFDLCMILKRDQVAPCCLGGVKDGCAPRLGWNVWLKAPEAVLQKDQHVTFQESHVQAEAAAHAPRTPRPPRERQG